MTDAASMKRQIDELQREVKRLKGAGQTYYASSDAAHEDLDGNKAMPLEGRMPGHTLELIQDVHELDFKERLNTSSYVNVVFENEELKAAAMGSRINLADQTVYPSSFKLHDTCVNMVANLWNCPEPADFKSRGVHAGAQTVGSTEACLLAGLCLKFRWRKWYAKRHNMTEDQVLAVRPNMVISTQFQAAWEKLFKYMDIEPKLIPVSHKDFALTGSAVKAAIDDKTIGVVCIMGNHYGGHYDPVHEICAVCQAINKEKGFEVGIHVDAASGGFVAPFQKYLQPWDFRCPSVLSISASGHKFGQSICGTGWVIWRQREGLSEHVAISVSYLGGQGESYTLNFSRPASGVYVQFYKFMRLGQAGYADLERNMMGVSKFLRDGLKNMTYKGKPRFQLMCHGDTGCLPVVTARLNPDIGLPYDNTDLQHALAEDHWYVSAYKMSLNHPITEEKQPLFHDAPKDEDMFRIVVKANMTMFLARDLLSVFEHTLAKMDKHFEDEAKVANVNRWPSKTEQGHSGHAC